MRIDPSASPKPASRASTHSPEAKRALVELHRAAVRLDALVLHGVSTVLASVWRVLQRARAGAGASSEVFLSELFAEGLDLRHQASFAARRASLARTRSSEGGASPRSAKDGEMETLAFTRGREPGLGLRMRGQTSLCSASIDVRIHTNPKKAV